MSKNATLGSERFWNVAASLATSGALVVSVLAARRLFVEHRATTNARANQQGRPVTNWSFLVHSGHMIGQSTAPVRMVEFADFQCPACARAEVMLDSVQHEAKVPFRIAFVQFPLTAIHADAFDAAVAAECGARQGRFEQMHHVLYVQQHAIGIRPWSAYAAAAGVPDTISFEQCRRDSATAAAVRQQSTIASDLGLIGTPTFVADGVLYPPGTPLQRILATMAEEP